MTEHRYPRRWEGAAAGQVYAQSREGQMPYAINKDGSITKFLCWSSAESAVAHVEYYCRELFDHHCDITKLDWSWMFAPTDQLTARAPDALREAAWESLVWLDQIVSDLARRDMPSIAADARKTRDALAAALAASE